MGAEHALQTGTATVIPAQFAGNTVTVPGLPLEIAAGREKRIAADERRSTPISIFVLSAFIGVHRRL
jgi:hypothetical protein